MQPLAENVPRSGDELRVAELRITPCCFAKASRSCATTGSRNSRIAACFSQLGAKPFGVENRANGVKLDLVAGVKMAVTHRVSFSSPSQRACTVQGG